MEGAEGVIPIDTSLGRIVPVKSRAGLQNWGEQFRHAGVGAAVKSPGFGTQTTVWVQCRVFRLKLSDLK